MKTYNSTNFFKHTFCEFHQINDFDLPTDKTYKSDSNSEYFYTEEGVYRKSNHWGRVANCRWKLIAKDKYKNQQTVVAYAKWIDFYPINSSEKNFFIAVDFNRKKVELKPKNHSTTTFLFTYSEASKRKKQIQHLFKNNKWTTFYSENSDDLTQKVIEQFINSNKTLVEIKRALKEPNSF